MNNKMADYPEVEILLATYNGEKYLPEQLDSIINQTYAHWRITASDDGSTDLTRRILEDYASRDSRITVLPPASPHGSACANFMNLLKRSTADYVMFSDQDDVWKPDKINQEMLAILKEESVEPGVPVLVASDLVVVSASLGVINKSFWDYQKLSPKRCQFRELCAQSIAPGCTMLINRELVQLARDSYGANMVMHDWWISLIASAFGRVRLIPQQTMLYRQHGDNSVGATQYSLTKKIFKFEKAKQGVMATLTQAEAFLEHFGSCLPKRYLRQLQSYAGILHESSGALRLARLIKSRCWKAGIARKVGQIVAVMSLSADSSNTN